jgi:hypothetical protein
VRGTRFRVGFAGAGVTHEVLSGSVATASRGQADTLMLNAGRGAVVGTANAGPAVDLLPPPQVITPDGTGTYSTARFSVAPQAGASAYHVQISTDQDALNVIAESRSAQPQLAVDGLRDGQYFMHVAALDRAGIEGFVRTQAFTLKQQPALASSRTTAPAAPSVERSDARSVTLHWAAQPGLRYQLQIARDADFSWLIHSAATESAEASVPRPPFGTYYARVQMIGPDGRLVASSSVQPFVVTDHWVLNDGKPASAKEPARSTPDSAR